MISELKRELKALKKEVENHTIEASKTLYHIMAGYTEPNNRDKGLYCVREAHKGVGADYTTLYFDKLSDYVIPANYQGSMLLDLTNNSPDNEDRGIFVIDAVDTRKRERITGAFSVDYVRSDEENGYPTAIFNIISRKEN